MCIREIGVLVEDDVLPAESEATTLIQGPPLQRIFQVPAVVQRTTFRLGGTNRCTE